jgi:hypothetical protein
MIEENKRLQEKQLSLHTQLNQGANQHNELSVQF